jgi:hypothetical protein
VLLGMFGVFLTRLLDVVGPLGVDLPRR